MGLINGLALVLLTLVGYSSGCVLGGRGRKIAPGPLDILMVVVLWAGALNFRGGWGKWLAILVWLLAGMATGIVVTALRRSGWPAAPAESPPGVSGHIFRRMWERWKAFAFETGNFQGRILFIFFYFLIVTPFGLLVRLFNDPLRLQHKSQPSFWVERPAPSTHLEDARRQF
jgi:hypothetical protein